MQLQYNGEITLATGASRTAARWKNKTLLWGAFLDQLKETTRTRETLAEYRQMSKTQQDAIKDTGGFVGGWLKQGRRKAENLEHRSVITLDADYATLDLLDSVTMFYGCAAAIYSTHKHTHDNPRLRLLIPMTRRVTGDEYQAATRMLAHDLGMDLFDDTTYQPARLMYWPSTSADGDYCFDFADGPWLDPDALLGRYPDWRDTSYWPESSRAVTVRHSIIKRQGDPLEKPGVVGAFCRTYTIEDAIDTFLPDKYAKCDAGDRYTFTGGSTAGGLVVYDGSLFAYSNHATDPVSGRLCNAFDLVRIHLFGDLDTEAPGDTPVNRLPSYLAMIDLSRKDDKVKVELAQESIERARADFDLPDNPEDSREWITQLDADKRGNFEQTIQNVFIILSNDPLLKGTLAFNAFKDRLVCIRSLPWKEVLDPVNGDAWTDADDSELRRYIELAYHIVGKERIMDAVSGVARMNTIHPVKDFLRGLDWDGVERLDTLLVDYLGAEDSEYTRAVTRKAFTAAVARIMRPGCKFDYVLVLAGPQGRGKSTLISRMSCGWYTDSLAGIGTKEAYEGIQGFWLVELGELAAMRKTEIEVTKNFISKQVDSYRAPYGRRVEDHKRQCVFFGTTNSSAFLRDDTGNRRFWPVRLGDQPAALTVWGDLTTDLITQLWAEAVVRYEEGEPLTLKGDLEAYAMEQQSDFTEDDPRAGEVQAYLEALLPTDWQSKDKSDRRMWLSDEFNKGVGTVRRDRVCVSEVWQECFGKDSSSMKRQDTAEVRTILRQMPGWKEQPKKQWFGPYGSQRCFERIADA
ncbi:MAG: virulence-associated E family protein [Oscillospiraceae bacterium]